MSTLSIHKVGRLDQARTVLFVTYLMFGSGWQPQASFTDGLRTITNELNPQAALLARQSAPQNHPCQTTSFQEPFPGLGIISHICLSVIAGRASGFARYQSRGASPEPPFRLPYRRAHQPDSISTSTCRERSALHMTAQPEEKY
jgi:hypothetical protein